MEEVEVDGSERRTLWFASAVITFLVLLQAPGRIVPETKLDITTDPVGYLSRALTAWDPSGGFGRVQNQAVGYLFPMGAFSALGHALAVPAWLTQRLWIALVLVAALWGAHRVARAIGVATPAGRIVAALAYALAPATLSIAAFQSAGQLPYALAPWVLVPLLTARDGDGPRRTAARSALWIAAMGGVNGASAFAVLPLVVIWFTTRAPGPARRRLAAWWGAGAVAATLWWLIPLAVSVRYGVRFTEFTESSSITTWTESATEILRGTGNWLSFLQTDAGPWLPGARALTADRIAVVGSIAVAAGGAWGLARRDAPGRSWLLPSFVLGATAMGIGYAGAWGGPLSGFAQDLLDGPLVPFRNVHKFAAVVHLPLAVGLGHLVAVLGARRVADQPTTPDDAEPATSRRLARAVPALAVAAIVLAILPAASRLTAPGSFVEVPAAWQQTAAWLDGHEGGQRALLLPGSSFGEYEWGRPLDEPLSSLLDGDQDWAVRDLIPLGGNGSTRLLDRIDQGLQTGTLPPGTVAALQRAGVRYLVVRNDLDLVRTGGPRPASVRRALQTAPDLRLVTSFGPARSDPGWDRRLTSPPGGPATEAFRQIDIYEVPDAVDRVAAYPAEQAAVVSGGPEAVAELDPALTDGRAVVLAVDDGADELPAPVRVATDTARRRDVEFGAIRDNVTYTLRADQASPVTGDPPQDRWPADRPTGLTTARLTGAAALTDSSRPGQPMHPELQPYSAFDGNPSTSWSPAKPRVGEWVQVALDEPTEIGDVTVRIPETTGARIGSVRVVTDQGSRTATIGDDGTVRVTPAPGATSTVRVAIDSLTGSRDADRVGISEIEIDGVEVSRPLVVPSPGGTPTVVSLQRDRADPFSLVRRDEDGVLDRIFRCCTEASTALHGTASANPGPELDALLAAASPDPQPSDLEATATSQLGGQPAFAPSAALDDDPLTAWVSAEEATAPAITIRWTGAVPLDNLQVHLLAGQGGDAVDRVRITVGGQTYDRDLPDSGEVTFPSTTTDEVTVSFPTDPNDPEAGRRVAVSEISIPALLGRTAATPDPDAAAALPCGKGPRVELDGKVIDTKSSGTIGDLLAGRAVPWEACRPLALSTGEHRLTAPASGATLVSTAVLEPSDGVPAAPAPRTVSVASWGAADRTVRIGAGDAAIVATTENANDGWVATLDGKQLEPIRVDGWRQGWRVPAGSAGTIHLRYEPAGTQRAGLLLGLLALAAVAVAAIVPARRSARAWAPPAERPWSAPFAYGLVVLAGVAVGGPLVLLGVPIVWAARRTSWLPAIAALGTVGAGLVTFVWAGAEVGEQTGTFSGPAQALAVVAVLALAAAVLPDRAVGDVSPEAAAGSTPSTRGRFGRQRP